MARPEDVLSLPEYKNYRNTRAVALLYIYLGGSYVLMSLVYFAEGSPIGPLHPQSGQAAVPPALMCALAIAGAAGLVGGIAIHQRYRQLAPLVYMMAVLYLFVVPIGTILSLVLLAGLSQYFKSLEWLERVNNSNDWNSGST